MTDVTALLRRTFEGAGTRGWACVRDVDRSRHVDVDGDELVPLASMFKLPLLVTLYRKIDRGEIDPAEPRELKPDDRSPGTTGVSAMADPARLSVRDVAYLMMALSDNASADHLLELVGAAAVRTTMRELGLRRTSVTMSSAEVRRQILADTGVDDTGGLTAALEHPGAMRSVRAFNPHTTNHSTPGELCHLIEMIWTDAAATPASCAIMRELLARQVWRHRLASGFPNDAIQVAGKTGTLPFWRGEVGMVAYPDARYSIAVVVRTSSPANVLPAADAVIGIAARLAVQHLRLRVDQANPTS